MQNHMTKKVFRNSKILHFLGVKSEFYHYSFVSVSKRQKSRISVFKFRKKLFWTCESSSPELLSNSSWPWLSQQVTLAKKIMKNLVTIGNHFIFFRIKLYRIQYKNVVKKWMVRDFSRIFHYLWCLAYLLDSYHA